MHVSAVESGYKQFQVAIPSCNELEVIGQDPGRTLDPTDSIDQWIGTVYHRFPLLEPRIRRIGFAVEGNVCVLDMGSLEEPQIIDS